MNSPQDTQKFRQCLEAAEQGDSEALFYVAFAYDSGVGVQQDKDEAFRWYMKAASFGNDKAQLMIGMFYEKGIVVKPNIEEAFKWYLKAAEQGNSTAQNQLGTWYFNKENLGLFQDWWNKSKAFKWFSKGAEQGNPISQTNLGYCYFYGCGTKKDYAAALEWYMKAAEQNNPDALFQVGYFYENGITVQENSNQALKWYRKAVAQGSSKAQERIDAMSRRIDSNPKTESSSNKNSDGNLNQTTDDNSGCLLFFIIAIIFITFFAIAAIQADKKQKKSSSVTATNRVAIETGNIIPECIPTIAYKLCRDSSSGLIWSDLSSQTMTWDDAVSYCTNLKIKNFNDWKLPNIDELRTLIKDRRTASKGTCKISEKSECLSKKSCWEKRDCAEACFTKYDELCETYSDGRYSKVGDDSKLWSFSSLSENSNNAWFVRFSSGIIDISQKNNSKICKVRCVRKDQ